MQKLQLHLQMLPDAIKAIPLDGIEVHTVTEYKLCEGETSMKKMLTEVHKLAKLYLTHTSHNSNRRMQLLCSQIHEDILEKFNVSTTLKSLHVNVTFRKLHKNLLGVMTEENTLDGASHDFNSITIHVYIYIYITYVQFWCGHCKMNVVWLAPPISDIFLFYSTRMRENYEVCSLMIWLNLSVQARLPSTEHGAYDWRAKRAWVGWMENLVLPRKPMSEYRLLNSRQFMGALSPIGEERKVAAQAEACHSVGGYL